MLQATNEFIIALDDALQTTHTQPNTANAQPNTANTQGNTANTQPNTTNNKQQTVPRAQLTELELKGLEPCCKAQLIEAQLTEARHSKLY